MARALFSILVIAFCLVQVYGQNEREDGPCKTGAECYNLDEAKRQAAAELKSEFNSKQSYLKDIQEALNDLSNKVAEFDFPIKMNNEVKEGEDKMHNATKSYYKDGVMQQKNGEFFKCISTCEFSGKKKLHEAKVAEIEKFKKDNDVIVEIIRAAERYQNTLSIKLTEKYDLFAKKIKDSITKLGVGWALNDGLKSFAEIIKESDKSVEELRVKAEKYVEDLNKHLTRCEEELKNIADECIDDMRNC